MHLLQENTANMCRKLEEELTKEKISGTIRQLQHILQQLIFLAEDVSKYY
jgi:hypothetical protein